MTAKQLPPPELLRQLLRYDPKTGKLFWRERGAELFNPTKGRGANHACAQWNSRFARKEAFTSNDNKGYKCGLIFGKGYFAHRVIWAMTQNEWPAAQIDHINGVRDDNRVGNLRAVTNRENCKNRRVRSDNSSGSTGVYFYAHQGIWVATICANGKNKYLGRFLNKDDAITARKEAEVKYGFHPNHGKR
tara:strand:- start:75 stop:641 length:567 start_codon:yes stop_codon:yes gene_type:complete